jgi:Phosphopantetheine attachment site
MLDSSAMVLVEELPLMPIGKVDVNRKALLAADQSRLEPEESFVATRIATEEVLAEIWAAVLKLDKVRMHEHFFDFGGPSLLTVRLTNTIQRQSDAPILVAYGFEAPVEQFTLLL